MMTPRINRLVFLAGGVLLPALPDLAARVLAPAHTPDTAQRLALHRAAQQLATGHIDGEGFSHQAITALNHPRQAVDAAPLLSAAVCPLPGMAPLIGELSARYELRFVSDYPPAWLLPALDRAGLAALFPASDILYTANYRGFLGLFGILVDEGVIQRGRSLWVDYHSPRASLALRQGIDVAIFVDAYRLRRDFGLWGLV